MPHKGNARQNIVKAANVGLVSGWHWLKQKAWPKNEKGTPKKTSTVGMFLLSSDFLGAEPWFTVLFHVLFSSRFSFLPYNHRGMLGVPLGGSAGFRPVSDPPSKDNSQSWIRKRMGTEHEKGKEEWNEKDNSLLDKATWKKNKSMVAEEHQGCLA